VPAQRRIQPQTPMLDQRGDVVGRQRLLRNARSQKSKQRPTHQGNTSGWEEASDSCQGKACNDKSKTKKETSGEKKCRRDMGRYCRMQANCDAASKSRGNRNGRQPHGVLRNLTSVSM
jgi:hypothetical protein